MEEWRLIAGCSNLYEISSLGNVRRVGYPEHLSLSVSNDGRYHRFYPSINGKKHEMLVHRAVARAFLPNIFNKRCVDHRNREGKDNRVVNLRWATHAENLLNRPGWSKTGLPKGVYKRGARYEAVFRRHSLGTFATPEEAHAAYVEAGTAHSPFFAAQ